MKPIPKILEIKVLLLGLEDVGKTVLLYKWKIDDIVTTVPTIGINIEKIIYHNLNITFWDVGGNDRIRPFWTTYYDGCHFICFVIDVSDFEGKNESIDLLRNIIADEASKPATLIIICNKQDVQEKMKKNEIENDFGLKELNRKYFIFETSYNEKGQNVLFEWMEENVPYLLIDS